MLTLAANAVLIAHRAACLVAGEAVLYVRGNEALAITAIPARAQNIDDGGDDFSHSAREKDWIIAAEDLVAVGEPFRPARGDVIRWESPDGLRQFNVLPRENDGRHYRHCDPTRVKLRVYTIEHPATPDP